MHSSSPDIPPRAARERRPFYLLAKKTKKEKKGMVVRVVSKGGEGRGGAVVEWQQIVCLAPHLNKLLCSSLKVHPPGLAVAVELYGLPAVCDEDQHGRWRCEYVTTWKHLRSTQTLLR